MLLMYHLTIVKSVEVAIAFNLIQQEHFSHRHVRYWEASIYCV